MGFSENRFTKEVDEDLKCSICQDIIEDPIASKCEHMFCKVCINKWLERESSCPVDRKPLNRSKLCELSRIICNIYSKLEIKCEFESNGCESIVSIEGLNNHQIKCKFNPNEKEVCEYGCDALLTKDDIISHNCVEHLKSINLKLKEELTESKALNTVI